MKTFFILFTILLVSNCSPKKNNDSQKKSLLSALTSTTSNTATLPKIPIVPDNFNFLPVNKSQIQIQNIQSSNGISKPFLTISLTEDFSEKVFTGFITSGQTFNIPLVIPNSVNTLYYRIYTSMDTATSGALTRTNENFILAQ